MIFSFYLCFSILIYTSVLPWIINYLESQQPSTPFYLNSQVCWETHARELETVRAGGIVINLVMVSDSKLLCGGVWSGPGN